MNDFKHDFVRRNNAERKAQWEGNIRTGYKCADIPSTLRFITEKYNRDRPFYFIRNGDGDHQTMKQGHNLLRRAKLRQAKQAKLGLPIQQHFEYLDKNLVRELNELIDIDDEEHFVITSWMAKSPNKRIRYWNFYAMHEAFLYPKIYIPWLVNTFGNKKNLFIGPQHVCDSALASRMYNFVSTYELPGVDSYLALDDNYEAIRDLVADHHGVICASGSAGKVLAKRLYEEGVNTRFIDIGACVDAIVGLKSRRWITKLFREDFPIRHGDLMKEYSLAFPECLQR